MVPVAILLNSLAQITSTGKMMLSISLTILQVSLKAASSKSDCPIWKPWALIMRFAIPPPRIRWSTFSDKFLINAVLVDILEPPMIATDGDSFFLIILLSAWISDKNNGMNQSEDN